MTEILEPHTGTGSHSHGGNPLQVLTKKIGPLPGWTYVVIAVGGFVAYRYWKARNTAATVPVTDAGADVVSGDASSVGSGASDAGSLGMGGTGTVTVTPIPVAKTNAEWASSVTTAMVQAGSPANDVANAISVWFAGGNLTAAQVAMINQIIAIYGPPPEGILPFNTTPVVDTTPPPSGGGTTVTPPPSGGGTTVTPPPVTTPKADPNAGLVFYVDTKTGEYWSVKPATFAVHRDTVSQVPVFKANGAVYRPVAGRPVYHGSTLTFVDDSKTNRVQYRVKSGDTWGSIAQHFYSDAALASRIQSANPGKSLKAGTVLEIPG